MVVHQQVTVISPEATGLTVPTTEMVERVEPHIVVIPSNGTGSYMIDFQHHRPGPTQALHVQPGQVRHRDDACSSWATTVMIAPEVCPEGLFDPLEPHPVVDLGARFEVIAAVAAAMVAEQDSPTPSRSVLVASAVLLLHQVARAQQEGPVAPTPQADLMRAFRSELEMSYTTTRSVSYYARALGTSPKTLSRATASLAGTSPKELIDRRVILEARRLLAHSTDSASSIGAMLGFSEPTNFTKFFVRHTGKSPQEFRVQV